MKHKNENSMLLIAKRIIPFAFYGILLFFLFFYISSIDFTKLSTMTINPWYLLLAGIFAMAFRYWGSYIWINILRGLGAHQISYSGELLYIYAKAWLARYIPGTAPWILSKIYFASQHGISKNKLAVSSVLEGALQVIALFILSFGILIFDSRLNVVGNQAKILMAVLLVFGIIVLIPRIFNFILARLYKILRKKTFSPDHYVTRKVILTGTLLYGIGAIMNGLGLFFIAKAFYADLPYDQILFVIGSGMLAGALGILAIFAPSGIGVRDGIQLALLSIVMPTEYALAITIATRLWDILIDLLFFASAILVKRIRRDHHDAA